MITVTVAAHHVTCAMHWRQVPKELQDAVYAEFRRKKVSPAHLRAIREVYRHLAPSEEME